MLLMEKRIRDLAADGISLKDIPQLGRAYKTQYGVKATSKDLIRYSVKIANDPTPTTKVEDVAATRIKTAHPTETQFVPEILMTYGNPIKEAVIMVGGTDAALKLGRIIEDVGGMTNFTQAVAFLESLNAIPSRPQIAPEQIRNLAKTS